MGVLKTLEQGLVIQQPAEELASVSSIEEGRPRFEDNALAYASHVLERLDAEGELSKHVRCGSFIAFDFMDDYMSGLLRQQGVLEIEHNEVWELAMAIRRDVLERAGRAVMEPLIEHDYQLVG